MRDTDCFHISPDLVSLQPFTPTLYSEYSNNGRTIMPIPSACMCWHLSLMHILIRVSWNEYYLRQTQKRLSKVMQTLANCKETWKFPLLIFIKCVNTFFLILYMPVHRICRLRGRWWDADLQDNNLVFEREDEMLIFTTPSSLSTQRPEYFQYTKLFGNLFLSVH